MANKFVFVFNNEKSIGLKLFESLSELNYVEVITNVYKINNKFLLKLFNHFNLKPRFILRKYYSLRKIDFNDKIVVFDNEALTHLSKRRLLKIKKKSKLVVLFFIDNLSNDYPSVSNAKQLFNKKIFDRVFTFSKEDSNKYGIDLNLCYYHKKDIGDKIIIKNDLFFVGNIKSRLNKIKELGLFFNKHAIKIDFNLSGNAYDLGFSYNSIGYLPYEECVKLMMGSNCILDIVDNEDSSVSLRYFEAIVYNKKLLTNNKKIVEMPLYNPKYMKVFDTLEDIDINWVKHQEEVNYNYNNEFEPINFIKKLDS